MDLMGSLRQGEGDAAISELARQAGISRAEAEAALAAVLPHLVGRIERMSLSRGGLADIVGLMGEAGGSRPGIAEGEAGRAAGNAILEQLLGNRDASRALAARAAATSGLSETVIKALLPYIAQWVIGALARRAGGGLGDIISKLPQMGGGAGGGGQGRGGRAPPSPPPTGTRGGGMLPGPDGSAPSGRNPYGDLSDIIRRGGRDASVGGSPLWRIVRNIIGAALGFQSRGVMAWLVRLIVLRYGWTILRTIFSRVLLRR